MQGTFFTLLFLSILLLPGFALTTLFKTDKVWPSRYLFSFGFSYALFALTLGLFQSLQLSAHLFQFWIIALLGASTCVIAYKVFVKKCIGNLGSLAEGSKYPVSIIVLVSIYHFFVGTYNEIPADIYAHLGYFQKALSVQLQNSMGVNNGLAYFKQEGFTWYHLVAFCSKLSGISTASTLYITTCLTKIVFLLGVYFFSTSVFSRVKQKNIIAFITVLFLSLHMGINVMAYLRYYSFAPTMLNLLIYFSAVAVFMQVLQVRKLTTVFWQLLYIVLLLLATAAVHTQEALFIVVMLSLVSLVVVVFPDLKNQPDTGNSALIRHFPKIFLVLSVVGFAAIYVFANKTMNRAPNIGWRLWEFGSIAEWLPSITTLNLRYQFIRVVTLWGVLVYIAAIFYWKDIRSNAFLIAGLISPLFTTMNPFFVDLFLRLDNSMTLWRMSYLIPLHFVAAFLFIRILANWRVEKNSMARKVFSIAFIALLFLLLLPIANTYGGAHYSRFSTLSSVQTDNSSEHFEDALKALSTLEKKYIVLTDPISGYVLSGMTHHYAYRQKFFARGYKQFSFDDYNGFPLKKHKGKLILINERVSGISRVGELSKHWPANILDVSKYYSKSLLTHLDVNPDRFALVWQSETGDVRLYKIL